MIPLFRELMTELKGLSLKQIINLFIRNFKAMGLIDKLFVVFGFIVLNVWYFTDNERWLLLLLGLFCFMALREKWQMSKKEVRN
ncbi:MAG: hypothetical protein HQL08_08720 [Nitrospirae bacterium]|nr:hypothetical protein [Nitrospirota bacterium]